MYKFILSFLLLFATPLMAEPGYSVIEDKTTIPTLTPSLQGQKIAKIKLDNGLEALIISDPEAEMSGAALSVEAGSWDNPHDQLGLAHFLEHMLFLGTEKYPDENSYSNYIHQHGGSQNAYTTSDHTNYSFAIENSAFNEALDRFSQFFIAPLLNESATNRERNAVNEEFEQNKAKDGHRQYYVLKEVASPNHPFSRFDAGNNQSLKDVQPQDLKAWYLSHYSSDKMHLVIYSNESIENLIGLVVQDFSSIAKRDAFTRNWPKEVWGANVQGKYIGIEPLKNLRQLSILWQLPASLFPQDEQNQQLMSALIGQEGPGSLISALKQEGLAQGLGADVSSIDKETFTLDIVIDLTPEGLLQKELVIEKVFYALSLYQQQIPDDLINEIQTMSKLSYEWRSRSEVFSSVTDAAGALIDYPLSTYPQNPAVISAISKEKIQQAFNLLTPEKALYIIMAHPDESKIQMPLTEKWMGANYGIQAVPVESLARWRTPESDSLIFLPPKNPLIPDSVSLLNPGIQFQPNAFPEPTGILQTSNGIGYWFKDTTYLTPTLSVRLFITSPSIDMGKPEKAALLDLYIKAVQENLATYSSQAEIAEISFAISTERDFIKISIDGLSAKTQEVLTKITSNLLNPLFSKEQFEVWKKSLLIAYENQEKDPPIQQAVAILRTTLLKKSSIAMDKKKALEKVEFKDVEKFSSKLFDSLSFGILFYGNIDASSATSMFKGLETLLGSKMPIGFTSKALILDFSALEEPLLFEKTISTEGSAAILVMAQNQKELKNEASMILLGQILETPFFSELRTKQQTGYIVQSRSQVIGTTPILVEMAQSSAYSAEDLLARFILFNETMAKEGLNVDSFKKAQASQQSLMSTPPQTMAGQTDALARLLIDQAGNFNHAKQLMDALVSLTYEEFLASSQATLSPASPHRIAILVHGPLPKARAFKTYKSLKKFKRSLAYD